MRRYKSRIFCVVILRRDVSEHVINLNPAEPKHHSLVEWRARRPKKCRQSHPSMPPPHWRKDWVCWPGEPPRSSSEQGKTKASRGFATKSLGRQRRTLLSILSASQVQSLACQYLCSQLRRWLCRCQVPDAFARPSGCDHSCILRSSGPGTPYSIAWCAHVCSAGTARHVAWRPIAWPRSCMTLLLWPARPSLTADMTLSLNPNPNTKP